MIFGVFTHFQGNLCVNSEQLPELDSWFNLDYITVMVDYELSSLQMSAQLFQAAMENELIESQLYRDRESQLNKKKRTKVTDTRLSPRNPKATENTSPTIKQDVIDHGKLFDGMSIYY